MYVQLSTHSIFTVSIFDTFVSVLDSINTKVVKYKSKNITTKKNSNLSSSNTYKSSSKVRFKSLLDSKTNYQYRLNYYS